MLWFNFILGLNFIFLCFKLIIIIHYHTTKQGKIKFKPRMKLNHNMYIILRYVAVSLYMICMSYPKFMLKAICILESTHT